MAHWWAGLELEAFHGSLLLLEDELALALIHLWCEARVLLLHAKVVLDQVEGLLVDLLVLMTLQELNLVQAWKVNTGHMYSDTHKNGHPHDASRPRSFGAFVPSQGGIPSLVPLDRFWSNIN